MVRRWWDQRLAEMEVAAEHGDAKTLHDGVKRLLAFVAQDEPSKRALAADPDAEQAGMTAHFRNVLNVNRDVQPAVVADAPDFSRIGLYLDLIIELWRSNVNMLPIDEYYDHSPNVKFLMPDKS